MATNNIPFLLKQRGITRYRLHKMSGVSWPTVDRLTKAKVIPDGTHWWIIKRIAEALGVGIEELEAQP